MARLLMLIGTARFRRARESERAGSPRSGVMVIYVDRIGRRDLGGVVMHELGHVLGLGHSGKGGLMAAQYHPTSQRCVDQGTVEAVAAKRGLPAAELNWCQ